TDLRLKKDAQESLYQYYGNKIFDNEDAQERFDAQYHRPVSVNIENKGAVLEQKANLQDHEKIVTDTSNNYRMLVTGGEKITKETLDSGVSAQTAGGYKTKGDAQKDFAKESTLGLEDKAMNDLPTMLTAAGWTPETGVTREVMNNVFNDTFSAFATMQEDGSIKWHDDIESGARAEILQEWKSFQSDVQPKNSVDPFTRTKKAVTSATTNAKANYIPSAQIEDNLKVANADIEKIKSSKSYTATQLDSALVAKEELDKQLTISKNIEKDVGDASIDVDKTREYLENGRVMTFTNTDGSEYTELVTAKRYKQYLSAQTSDLSDTLLTTTVTAENKEKFTASLTEMKRLEQLNSGKKSAFTNKYDNMFAQDTLSSVTDRTSLTQALAYHNFKAQTNENWKLNKGIRVQLQDLLNKTIDGKPLTPMQLKTSVDSVLTNDKNTKLSKSANVELNKTVNDSVDDVSTGTGLWTTALNADVPPSSNIAIAKDISTNGKELDADGYVKDMEWVDYGKTLTGTDTRIPNIKGVDKNVTTMAIDQVRLAWNDKQGTNFGKEDISLKVRFDEGSNNYVIEVFNRKNSNQKLGELNSSNVEIVANKEVNGAMFRTDAYKKAMRRLNGTSDLVMPKDLDDKEIENPTKAEIKRANPDVVLPKNTDVAQDIKKQIAATDKQLKAYENSKSNKSGGWDKNTGKWYPHKSIEGGTPTVAYGHKLDAAEIKSGEIYGINFKDGLTDDEAEKIFQIDKREHLDRAKKMIPKYDTLSVNLQDQLMFATYRGSLGGSPAARKLINDGEYEKAADEFLNNAEYRKAKAENTGVAKRMEDVAQALRDEARRA
ncbi:MAG: hypothetical protein DRP93_03395, partial [Candidatus Neomarinimicrobiota bacterium]